MADDEIEVAGLVRSPGNPAAAGRDSFFGQVGGDEAAQLFQMPGLK
jgi:hypothetical protein